MIFRVEDGESIPAFFVLWGVIKVTDENDSKARVNFEGIPTDTYYYEIEVPADYNRLKEPIAIMIEPITDENDKVSVQLAR